MNVDRIGSSWNVNERGLNANCLKVIDKEFGGCSSGHEDDSDLWIEAQGPSKQGEGKIRVEVSFVDCND